jgi:prepilin-type N-terminal cleavage/methylation domain-containing protein/prepilin-type processing-associated H-X9-DG protein
MTINRQSIPARRDSRKSKAFTFLIELPVVRKGFTLIELLVVVAIISLLVSILLPSLNKAKSLAKRVVCASNLKQIGVAIRIYLVDSKGVYPAAVRDGAISGFPVVWAGRTEPVPGILGYGSWSEEQYFQENANIIVRCPANTSTGLSGRINYICNDNIMPDSRADPWGHSDWVNEFQIKDSSEIIILADKRIGFHVAMIAYDDNTLIGDYHSGGSNLMFMDSSVQWMELDSITPDLIVP